MNLIKNIIIVSLVAVFAFAEFGELSLDDLDKGGGSLSIISVGGKNVLNMNMARDFGLGDFKLGLGLNIVIPEAERPSGLNFLEFRYVEYDNKLFGVRYGLLSGVNYGYGLIMDNYNSAPGITYFDQSKAGFKAYTTAYKPFGVYGMLTNSQLMGARLTYDLADAPVINKPIVLGGSYVRDANGVISGNQTYNENANAYEIDLGVNIIEKFLDTYVEFGNLSNGSSGWSTGFKFYLGEGFNIKTEFRSFGKNFVPGFFNSKYESFPVNLATYTSKATTGYFLGLDYSLLPLGMISVGYTAYKDEEAAFKGSVIFKEVMGYTGIISYEKYVFLPTPYEVHGTIIYKLTAYTSAVVDIIKVGDADPTYTTSIKMNF